MKPKLSENKMLAFRTEEVHVQLVRKFIGGFFKQMNLFFYRFINLMFKAEILSVSSVLFPIIIV